MGQDLGAFDIQGHRGCRGLLPENTLPAFIHALDLGVRTLELDVVISHDNHVVVSHDPWMSARICSDPLGCSIEPDRERTLNIYRMELDEIRKYDCGSKQNPFFPEQKTVSTKKPTLAEMIEVCEFHVDKTKRAPAYYNIEIKSDPDWDNVFHPSPPLFCDLVYERIKELLAEGRVTIQSFDVRILQYWLQQWPETSLALLVENRNTIRQNLDLLGFRPRVYSPEYVLLSEQDIAYLHHEGMKVVPWTVNNKADMTRLISWGVDGMITDYPDRFFDLYNIKH
jgi:glycerophosphoryl diester phosphodiesterase